MPSKRYRGVPTEKRELTREELFEKNRILEERLREAEQTIQAIRSGEVDAFICSCTHGGANL